MMKLILVTQLNAMDVVQMTPCDGTAESEMWCCGETRDCCDHGKALVVPKVLGMKSISSSSTNVIGPVSPTASSAMGIQTSQGDGARNWNIGLGVGVGLGLPIMFVLSMVLAMYRSRRKSIEPQAQPEECIKEVPLSLSEASGEEQANELDDGRTNLELPGGDGVSLSFVGQLRCSVAWN
jgi:hypothetical protein